MVLKSLFIQFYCLPIRDILILVAVATSVFLRLNAHFQNRRLWKCLLFAALVGFTAVILHLTVTTRESAAADALFVVPFHSYRAVVNGDNPEILRSNFMNVVLFYPSGLLMASLLPRTWPRWCRSLLTLLLFAGLSSAVEYIQYSYSMGLAEIDDVIHNSLGALLGSICGMLFLPRTGKRDV